MKCLKKLATIILILIFASQISQAATSTGENIYYIPPNSNVGMGILNPEATLHVNGSFLMNDGNQASGYGLGSDANGLASWQVIPPSGDWVDTGSLLYTADSSGTEDSVILGGTSVATADIILNADGSAIFNENGNDADFRVEGNVQSKLIYTDADVDQVCFYGFTGAPNEKFTLVGILSLKESSAPSASSNYGKIYSGIDNDLHFINDSGTDYNLSELSDTPWDESTTVLSPSSSEAVLVGGTSSANSDIVLDEISTSDTTFNKANNDSDFRIEGDSDENLFFVDASTNRVGIGTSTPNEKFTINGAVSLGHDTTPGATTNYGKIYGAVYELYFKDDSNTQHDLNNIAGSTPGGSNRDLIKNTSGQFAAAMGKYRNNGGAMAVSSSNFMAGNGTYALPAYSFIDDPDTGFTQGEDGLNSIRLVTAGQMRVNINGTGVWLNTTSSQSYKFYVFGSAAKNDGSSVWNSASDIRLKNVLGSYTKGLDEILKLKPVRFKYKKNNPLELPSNEDFVGYIAQDVEKVFPEAVSKREDGYLDLNVHPINIANFNAIKELRERKNKKISDQQKYIALLKKEIVKIKEEIDKL